MADQYLAALYPDRHRVLGRWLQPCSLGHALLLQRLGNPYFGISNLKSEISDCGPGDLLLAISLCALPYRRALRVFHRPTFKAMLRWRAWWLPVRFPGPLYTIECLKWAAYLRASWSQPETWQSANRGRSLGISVLQAIKLTLTAHLGYPVRDALNTPLALALWDYAGYWDLEDRLQVVSDSDAALMDAADRLASEN
jgi:hypothetical protein